MRQRFFAVAFSLTLFLFCLSCSGLKKAGTEKRVLVFFETKGYYLNEFNRGLSGCSLCTMTKSIYSNRCGSGSGTCTNFSNLDKK